MRTILPQDSILSKANTVTVDVEKFAKLKAAGGMQVNADWNADSGPAQILNKPTQVSKFENDAGYITSLDIDGKADKCIPSAPGNLAALDENGNLIDSGKNENNFATVSHVHTVSQIPGLQNELDNKVDKDGDKKLSTNDYTNDDKDKLDGIEPGAKVNQNAFSNVKVGTTTVSAVAKTDTLELVQGNNIMILSDPDGRRIAIHAAGEGETIMPVQSDWNQEDMLQLDYIKNKPMSFPPSGHNHSMDEVTGLISQLQNILAAINGKVGNDEIAQVARTGSYNDLLDKPDIPSMQTNADWNASSGLAQILNKPNLDIYAEKTKLAAVASSGNYNDLNNKPTIPAAQVNSNWNATSGVAQILNKPTLGTAAAKNVPASGNASASQVVMGNDTRLTNARTPTAHNHSNLVSGSGTLTLSNNTLTLKYGSDITTIRPRWQEQHVSVTNVASGWSFRRDDSYSSWDNKLKFLTWGSFAYIVGNVKKTSALVADTTYSSIGIINCPAGYNIQAMNTGASLEGVLFAITGNELIHAYAIKQIKANDVLTLRVFVPCIQTV